MVKHYTIRALLRIVAFHDYKLEQLDVKTAFLHWELEVDIYCFVLISMPNSIPKRRNYSCPAL